MENRDDPNASAEVTETLVSESSERGRRGLVVPGDETAAAAGAPERDGALPDVLGLLGEHTPVPFETTHPPTDDADPSLTSMSLPPPPPYAAITYPSPQPAASSMRVVRRKIRKLGGSDSESSPSDRPASEPLADDAPTAPKLPKVTNADEPRPVAKGSPLVVAVSRTPVPPTARPVSLEQIKPTPVPSPPVPRVLAISADDFSVPPVEAVVPGSSEGADEAAVMAESAPTPAPSREPPPPPPASAGDGQVATREPPPRKPPSIPPPGARPVVIARPPESPVPADVASPTEPSDADSVELSIDDSAEDVDRISFPDDSIPRAVSLPPPPPEAAMAAPKPSASRASAVTVVEAKRKRRYWWEELFTEDYFRTLPVLEREQIRSEVDWIEQSLGTESGAAILDLACGAGHHAAELALRRYELTGLDLSAAMIARAAETATALGADVRWAQLDMGAMEFEDAFDAAYCIGTSFGLFDDERNHDVIRRLHRALRPNGTFLLQVLNRDHVIQRQPAMAWFEGDGCVCMEETAFNFITSRLNVKRTMIFDDGRQREIEYSVRLYSLHELGQVLHQAGFRILEVSGHPRTPGAFFGATSRELIILAQKRGAEVVEIPGSSDTTSKQPPQRD